MDPKQHKQVTTGIVLILIGMVFLFKQLNLISGLDIGRLWPIVLIVIGLGRLGTPDSKGRRGRQGHALIMVGTIFLLDTFRVLRLQDSWPLFIVAAGVGMLLNRGEGDSKEQTNAH
jgi:hypothetical protein